MRKVTQDLGYPPTNTNYKCQNKRWSVLSYHTFNNIFANYEGPNLTV